MRFLVMVARDAENPALGGGEIVLSEFAKALVRAGHEVDCLCASFPSAKATVWSDGVVLHRIGKETVLGAAAFLAYRRQTDGGADVVLEDILGGSRLPFFAPLYVRKPIISVWHQDHIPIFRHQYPRLLMPALAGLEKLLVWTHDHCEILVPSARARADLVRKGGNVDRIRVFHPGISNHVATSGPPPPAALRDPRIVCLGKIRRYKRTHVAILVLSKVLRRVPSARLAIIGRQGDGKYLRELVALTKTLGLEGNVDFEIGASEDHKVHLLRSSRALLVPSPVEGFGIAIAEASACGLPTVGTDGVPEDSLKDGLNGFRVRIDDIRTMTEQVVTLLTDDVLFDDLSCRAREFGLQFTWEKASEPLLELVAKLEMGHD